MSTDLLQLVHEETAAHAAFLAAHEWLVTQVAKPDGVRFDNSPWPNVTRDEADNYARLRRKAARAKRAVTAYVENSVRQELRFRKIGEGWVSETLLAQLVANLLPKRHLTRNHRPEWLEGLELDIFVPELRLGIEYQGQQHFHAVTAWGGEKALLRVQDNHRRKAELCRLAGVTLVTVDYTEPLTPEYIATLLQRFLESESM